MTLKTSNLKLKTAIRHRKRGQSLVEFAMVFPVLFLVVVAMIQFAIILGDQQKTQMSTWFAVRASTYDRGHRHYSNAEAIQNAVGPAFFPKHVTATVHMQDALGGQVALLDGAYEAFELGTVTAGGHQAGVQSKFEAASAIQWPAFEKIFHRMIHDDNQFIMGEKTEMLYLNFNW